VVATPWVAVTAAPIRPTKPEVFLFAWTSTKALALASTTLPRPLKGQNREVCLEFATRSCTCTCGSKCNTFLNFKPKKQDRVDKLVASLSNIWFTDGLTKWTRPPPKPNTIALAAKVAAQPLLSKTTRRAKPQPLPSHKVRHK
jgi:hypothetical protein